MVRSSFSFRVRRRNAARLYTPHAIHTYDASAVISTVSARLSSARACSNRATLRRRRHRRRVVVVVIVIVECARARARACRTSTGVRESPPLLSFVARRDDADSGSRSRASCGLSAPAGRPLAIDGGGADGERPEVSATTGRARRT